jgi:hypothetical protein
MLNEGMSASPPLGRHTTEQPVRDATAAVVVAVDDSRELSWAAETANGTRDRTMFLVLDRDGHLQVTETRQNTDHELRRIRTDSCMPNRRKVLEVSCEVDGWNDPLRLSSAEKWDAIFWTESSIEKFLYPYYHCQRLWSPLLEMLKEEFERDADAVAIAHQAPSNSRVLGRSVLSTIGVGRLTSQGGVTTLAWMSGYAYLVLRGRQ